jgi:hypothetical protein
MQERLHRRSDWEVRANFVCTLCARTVGSAHGLAGRPLTSASIRVHDASHADAVRRLRCPHCLGRLWLQDGEGLHVEPYAPGAEDCNPGRGRRRGSARVS